jgi:uncharacterized protein (TIGR03435 family)
MKTTSAILVGTLICCTGFLHSCFHLPLAPPVTAASDLRPHGVGAEPQSATRSLDPAEDPQFAQYVFATAVLKPHPAGNSGTRVYVHWPDDGLSVSNTPIRFLVGLAYLGDFDELSRGPDWFNDERYDFHAKFSARAAYAFGRLGPGDRYIARQHALRVFLKARTALAVHYTPKEIASFDLVIGPNGTRLTPSKRANNPNGGFRVYRARNTVTATAVPLSVLVAYIARSAQRPVFDKTGLTGVYDFTLPFMRDFLQENIPLPIRDLAEAPQPPPAAPTLVDAAATDLGLFLVPSRGDITVVNVDSVARPATN